MKNHFTALVALCALALGACENSKPTEVQPESFPVTSIMLTDTSTFTDYVTEIHATQNVEIRARVAGYLEKIHVDEGAHVREGQLLFSINNREYAEELAKAKALFKSSVVEVDAAELELKNVLQLAEKKIVSNTEVSVARNKLDSQKAKMDEAQAHQAYVQIKLSNTEIRAPFDGTINRIPHKIGSLIDEGTLLTSISEYEEVYAYFDVSEKEYLRYARSLQSDSVESKIVTLLLADGNEHPHKGVIETVEGIIDESTGNIAFRAKFKNPDKIIKHGASGRVRLRKKFDDVLLVPQKSTFEIQDKQYVYVVDNNNRVQIRAIESIARLPHFFIVNKGLESGERIVFEGIQNIRADMIIRPEETSMPEIIKAFASTKP